MRGSEPNSLIGPACGKQGMSPASLSQESHEFGPRDNRRCNPESAGANEHRLRKGNGPVGPLAFSFKCPTILAPSSLPQSWLLTDNAKHLI
jgi:hypothetical protein